jgi:hypothetical protein
MRAWKAFRLDKDKNLRFLFHTYQGSSLVPIGKWIETKSPWVNEGRRKKYRSGFHYFPTLDDTRKFRSITKNKYLILPVEVKDVRSKPHSSVGSWLARKLFVPKKGDFGFLLWINCTGDK